MARPLCPACAGTLSHITAGATPARTRRNAAIRRAYLDHGDSLLEIGRTVGLQEATIGRMLNLLTVVDTQNKI